jgi:ribosome-associated toxin RatA of RatAB toxin-antitoxin module
MAVIDRRARVPYSTEQMLRLVNDINAYPEFLHWCHGAQIEKEEGSNVEAALEIGIGGVYKTIRTRNVTTISPAEGMAKIQIQMLEGPLKSLNGHWQFADLPESGCDVELRLEYETPRSPFGLLLSGLFNEIANSQLNAFIARAKVVYGQI